MQRTVGGGIERNCVESVTKAAQVYNSIFYASVMALKKSLSDARIVYLDVYTRLNDLVQHPHQFGKFLHLYLALLLFQLSHHSYIS